MKNFMKQAQQMQAKMLKVQEELADQAIEISSGGGMVKVIVNGRLQIKSIRIQKEVVDPNDIEMLEDLIVAAVNEALKTVQKKSNVEMEKLTSGMKIPGLF